MYVRFIAPDIMMKFPVKTSTDIEYDPINRVCPIPFQYKFLTRL